MARQPRAGPFVSARGPIGRSRKTILETTNARMSDIADTRDPASALRPVSRSRNSGYMSWKQGPERGHTLFESPIELGRCDE